MLQQRDFANAQEQFNLALQTNQQDPMIWNGLGLAQANLGRIDEAISNYRHALALNPNYNHPKKKIKNPLRTKQLTRRVIIIRKLN